MKVFDFKKQFDTPVEFYKSRMLLRLLNEEIDISGIYIDHEDLGDVVDFCDEHDIQITGLDVKQFSMTGGEKISDETVAEVLRKKLGIESTGRIIHYNITDLEQGIYPYIYCVETPGERKGFRTITEEELLDAVFSSGLDCTDADPYLLRQEPSDPQDFMRVADPLEHIGDLSLWKARVHVTTPYVKHWKDIAWIERPINARGNDWVLQDEEVQLFIEEEFNINPVLRLSRENFQRGLRLGKDRLTFIREFDLPLFSDTVAYMSARHPGKAPRGICINCLKEDLLSDKAIECGRCGSRMIMHYDDSFPADIDVVVDVRDYLTELTGMSIDSR